MATERYLFLGGHRKCGTTLLLNLFDGHDQCCVYPTDIAVLYGYYPAWTAEGYTAEERLTRLDLVVFGTLFKIRERHRLHDVLPVEAMREHFHASLDHHRLRDIGALIRQVIDSYRFVTRQPVEARPVTVIKETSLEIYARELAESFPDARFVQPLRDPRDNLGALRAGLAKRYLQMGEGERHLLASLVHRVGVGMGLIPANRAALGTERFRTVAFEAFAADPQAVLESLCRFAGLESSPALAVPTIMGRPASGNNYDGEPFKAVTSRNVGRWRDRISDFEAQVIEFHLGALMTAHGYQLAFTSADAARAASEFYKWTNHQYFFRDAFPALRPLLETTATS
jgi:hypothetical protein